MDYKKIYTALIRSATDRPLKPGEYYERHHIKPRSMGGDNSDDNLVYLTAREHYVAHWLLYKIHRNRAMATAWFFMRTHSSGKRYNASSFDYAKKAHIKHLTGIRHTEEHKRKISVAGMGRKNSDTQKKAAAKANACRVWSDESRRKASIAKAGIYVKGKHSRARKIVNTDTGDVFDCMVDAAESIGVTKAAIHNQIKRGGKNKGFRFEYAD